MITEDLIDRNRLSLAHLTLARDPVFQKLSQAERQALIETVTQVGRGLALAVGEENKSQDPRKIAEKLGIKVVGEKNGKGRASEFRKKTNTIVVYRDALERLTEEITVPHLSGRILRLLVAREVFNHLEQGQTGKIYKRYPFIFQKGPFKVKKYIPALSEVACLSFIQTLLELDLSPRVFAYLLYMLFYKKKLA